MTIIISGGTIVNEGQQFVGTIIVEDDTIVAVSRGVVKPSVLAGDIFLDATGQYVLPGMIDTHVHFRTPGLTHKGDLRSESRAAAAGGVTAFCDMPNTVPPTATASALAEKHALAAASSSVNYAFYPVATADNAPFLRSVDATTIPALKLFMGSTTGSIRVADETILRQIFALAAERGLIVMIHGEDDSIIASNMEHYKTTLATADPSVSYHPLIRSREACVAATSRAAALARECGARLHIAHLSTADELSLLGGVITGEVCVSYLLFSAADYATRGTRIKCNPSIKDRSDQRALRKALYQGRLATVATDHAPHLLKEKEGGVATAASGMPMVQYALPALLTVATHDDVPLSVVAAATAHRPAQMFSIVRRGFLRAGYKADITIVEKKTWTVSDSDVVSRCAWTPLAGDTLRWKVTHTLCNGKMVFSNGKIDDSVRGEALVFAHGTPLLNSTSAR